MVLQRQVDRTQGNDEQPQPGHGIQTDGEGPQQAEELGQQDVQDERERIVDSVDVGREAIQDATQWGNVEELELCLRGKMDLVVVNKYIIHTYKNHAVQQFIVDALGRFNPGVGKQERPDQR